jgi:hypothetical protein
MQPGSIPISCAAWKAASARAARAARHRRGSCDRRAGPSASSRRAHDRRAQPSGSARPRATRTLGAAIDAARAARDRTRKSKLGADREEARAGGVLALAPIALSFEDLV